MKLNILILSLLAIVPLSGCNKIDPKPTANIATTPVSLSSERFRFFRDNKFGYIDRNGKLVIPARFEQASDFSEGLATVKIGEKYGCIDSSGKVVIPARFDYIYEFKNGLAEITLDRLEKGKIDKTGKIVTAPSSPQSTPLADSNRPSDMKPDVLTLVEKDGKYGYEDGNKKMVIPAQFDFGVDTFVEDMAWVVVKDRVGYINKKGKTIVSPQFDYRGGSGTGNFDNGLARVCSNSKCGYIDKTGKIVIPLKFDDAAQKFRAGLAWVKIGERLGFIDKTGKVVIPGQYTYYYPHKAGMEMNSNFNRGLAQVTIRDKCLFGIEGCYEYGYIDLMGKLVFKF
jgi:hypothetical protein